MCLGDLVGARASMEAALLRHDELGPECELDRPSSAAYEDANTLAHLAWLDWLMEGSAAALARVGKAVERGDASPRAFTKVYSLGLSAMVCQMAGRGHEATLLAQRSGAIAAQCGFTYWTTISSAVCSWARTIEAGSCDALRDLRHALVAYQRTQGTILLPYLLGLLADAELATGSARLALDALEAAEDCARATGARFYHPTNLLARGRILAECARREEALLCVRQARQMATADGALALAGTAAKLEHGLSANLVSK